MKRYDLTDFEWSVIEPLLPNKPRCVPRVDDRRVLNGIMSGPRGGTCRSATGPTRPATTASIAGARTGGLGSPYGRDRRGLGRRHTDDRQLQRLGSPSRCGLKKGGPDRCMGRSRGGLTTRIHSVVDASGLPLRFALSPGQAPRQHAWRSFARRSPAARQLRARRQGLRRGMDQGDDRGPGCGAHHLRPQQRHHAPCLQPRSLPQAQPGRAFLQLTQTVPTYRNTLRKARRQLPLYDENRHNPHLAAS